MTWNQWYAFRSYFRASLWIVPFIALLLEQVTFRIAYALDARFAWVPAWPFGLSGTQTALQTIITLILSFIVFTFASLLVAIQVASGQLTPRIIATTLLRDNVIRLTVGLFVFTLLFALGTVARIESTVPRLVMWTAASLGLISVMAFLFLIDYAARLLRPVSILWRVGEHGLSVIESVYPRPSSAADAPRAQRHQLGAPDRIVVHRGTSAILLAVNLEALVAEASRVDGVIESCPGSAISSPPASRSICSAAAAVHSTSASCGAGLPSDMSAPSSRTLLSRCESSSISRSEPCRRRSMIRQRRCSPSTNFTACFAMSAGDTCTTRANLGRRRSPAGDFPDSELG
jgi:uncharacterized membrane protein